ncbi:uncharacterized protein G2W53_034994 [Senna tora]|uniref:Uncharacterized protein n=1 Tax=Senna tora TaxID=362788 RepID=A0A834W740_9FABA|nr:uncharacterized protein G2W53_034994 [Senna tora]
MGQKTFIRWPATRLRPHRKGSGPSPFQGVHLLNCP